MNDINDIETCNTCQAEVHPTMMESHKDLHREPEPQYARVWIDDKGFHLEMVRNDE